MNLILKKSVYVKIFSKIRNHDDVYRFQMTETGWFVKIITLEFYCDKQLRDFDTQEIKVFNQECISYPVDISNYFETLWEQVNKSKNFKELERGLKNIAKWISVCEKNSLEQFKFFLPRLKKEKQ